MVAESHLVAAAFPVAADGQAAVKELRQSGFEESQVSVLYTDAGHMIKAGIIDGAVWGGVLGGLVGLFFPPVGLLIAAGPIVGALTSGVGLAAAGAVTVAAVEGVISGLVNLGLPQDIATRMGEHIHKGDVLVIAHAGSDALASKAVAILESYHPRTEGAPTTGGVVSVGPS